MPDVLLEAGRVLNELSEGWWKRWQAMLGQPTT